MNFGVSYIVPSRFVVCHERGPWYFFRIVKAY